MGLFRRRSEEAGELDRLRIGLGELRERLDESDAAKAELGSKIRSLTERLETPITAPPLEPPAPAVVRPTVDVAELEAVRAQIARLTVRLEALDRRITTISTELANQLGELSDDIDTLGKRAEADTVDEAALVALRDAQTRLASEQARYQIAFRQDLAEIAERWRRS
jgi:chromosome segregation ATPase